jgi:L-fuconolactonase
MAKGTTVERTRRAFVPDEAWLAKQAREPILEPDLPIVDPHHHLWDHANHRYLLDELLADTGSGHNITATVYIDCRSMYRADGPPEMKPVGETEFANGVAAMSASGVYGPTRACAGIISYVDMMLGARARAVLEAHVAAGNGRFRGIRHAGAWDASPDIRRSHTAPPQSLYALPAFREGFGRLSPLGLSFEAWQYHPQLPEVTDLARAFPETLILLDHVGGPLGIGPYAGQRDAVFAGWRRDIQELARQPNVWVKLGGLGMPICGFEHHKRDQLPGSADLAEAWRPYIETCIEAFGPARAMFESNFPVDRASCSYANLWNAFKRITAGASAADKALLYRDTARKFYRLPPAT